MLSKTIFVLWRENNTGLKTLVAGQRWDSQEIEFSDKNDWKLAYEEFIDVLGYSISSCEFLSRKLVYAAFFF